ncbi:multiubiquitin domain-containing protein [Nocardioides renjunii]|uniref:multiubiquitin domain-containing protein n=1 Tax=Nocardioides renjunii TaxID=3095075 RepID=UPI002AFE31A5|nr:multiubiquitin domain-containing protein [Nocardioides sp. S-34]WQQ23877.1 multiubiquitin domain-containing protein [Nocardioides sp. S-34]
MSTETKAAKPPKPEKIPIYIDGTKYQAHANELTGTQVRALAQPPVGEDRDLWLDVVDELDRLVGNDEVIKMVDRMRFFTVPRVINPGQRQPRTHAAARDTVHP